MPITGSPYVYPVSLPSGTKGTAINLGAETTGGDGIHTIAISPDGSTAYAAGALESDGDPSVVPIDLANGQAGTPIDLTTPTGSDEASMFAVAITPDGKTVYASFESYSDGVVPIPTATDTPGTAITTGIGSEDWAIAITPDQPPVASFTVTAAPPGSATMFDASASTAQFGTITKYAWSFGDGSPVVDTSGPTTTHVYSKAGMYTASVTETDTAGTTASTSRQVVIGGGPAPAVSLSATSLDFGQLAAGATASKKVTVTNTGAGTLDVSSLTLGGDDAGDYTLTGDGCSGQSVGAGEDCTVDVRFAPSEPGPRTARLSIADNASGSPQTLALTGTGAKQATLSGTVTAASGGAAIVGASVRACTDVGVAASCSYATTGSSGGYSFALAPNTYDVEVFPASSSLNSGAALVDVRYADNTQDFSLQAPSPIPAERDAQLGRRDVHQRCPTDLQQRPDLDHREVAHPNRHRPGARGPRGEHGPDRDLHDDRSDHSERRRRRAGRPAGGSGDHRSAVRLGREGRPHLACVHRAGRRSSTPAGRGSHRQPRRDLRMCAQQ